MTDTPAHEVTNEDRRRARDWAELVMSHPDTWTERLRAAARVVLAAVPAPPTMADMTAEERATCDRMQADVEGEDTPGVIISSNWEAGDTLVLWPGGAFAHPDWAQVTPRPDLPRMEWPGDTPTPTAPALPPGWKLADHPDYDRVVVTSDTVDADGHVYFVAPAPGTIGNDWHLCRENELTYLDTPAQPNTLTLGSKWNDTDALADACEESERDQITVIDANGYAFIWAYDAEWWEGSAQPIDAPYTIIHTGKHPNP